MCCMNPLTKTGLYLQKRPNFQSYLGIHVNPEDLVSVRGDTMTGQMGGHQSTVYLF